MSRCGRRSVTDVLRTMRGDAGPICRCQTEGVCIDDVPLMMGCGINGAESTSVDEETCTSELICNVES